MKKEGVSSAEAGFPSVVRSTMTTVAANKMSVLLHADTCTESQGSDFFVGVAFALIHASQKCTFYC